MRACLRAAAGSFRLSIASRSWWRARATLPWPRAVNAAETCSGSTASSAPAALATGAAARHNRAPRTGIHGRRETVDGMTALRWWCATCAGEPNAQIQTLSRLGAAREAHIGSPAGCASVEGRTDARQWSAAAAPGAGPAAERAAAGRPNAPCRRAALRRPPWSMGYVRVAYRTGWLSRTPPRADSTLTRVLPGTGELRMSSWYP